MNLYYTSKVKESYGSQSEDRTVNYLMMKTLVLILFSRRVLECCSASVRNF